LPVVQEVISLAFIRWSRSKMASRDAYEGCAGGRSMGREEEEIASSGSVSVIPSLPPKLYGAPE
jgi:hypothetical protein